MNKSLRLAVVDESGTVVGEIGLEDVPANASFEILGRNEGFKPIMSRYLDWVVKNSVMKNWPGDLRDVERNNIEWGLSFYDKKLYKPIFYVG